MKNYVYVLRAPLLCKTITIIDNNGNREAVFAGSFSYMFKPTDENLDKDLGRYSYSRILARMSSLWENLVTPIFGVQTFSERSNRIEVGQLVYRFDDKFVTMPLVFDSEFYFPKYYGQVVKVMEGSILGWTKQNSLIYDNAD